MIVNCIYSAVSDFCVPDHWKQTVLSKVRSQSNIKGKSWEVPGIQFSLLVFG